MILYDSRLSGNGWKVRLLLNALAMPYERRVLVPLKGETRTDGFRAKNPLGRVPALQLPDGSVLNESNAILAYLAEGTLFHGADRTERHAVLSWLFVEQFDLALPLSLPRYHLRIACDRPADTAEFDELKARATRALRSIDLHLGSRAWLALGRCTIADIGVYPYTALASDAGVDLAGLDNLLAWQRRIEGCPWFAPLLDGAAPAATGTSNQK